MIDISLNWLDKITESINFEKLPHGIIINGPIGIGKEFLSRMIVLRPKRLAYKAAEVPAGPAPTIIISYEFVMNFV